MQLYCGNEYHFISTISYTASHIRSDKLLEV